MATGAESGALKNELIKAIDREELVELACDLVNIPSATGYERRCADYIIDRYQRTGIKLLPQVFEETRSNAIGIIRGEGRGPCLMFNGHIWDSRRPRIKRTNDVRRNPAGYRSRENSGNHRREG
jgi:hypothetical protein